MPMDEAATLDRFMGGLVALRQPGAGHRAGTDAALLAACVPPGFSGLAVDMGSGVGPVGLAVALLEPACRVRLLECDPPTAELARANVALNALSTRVTVVEADVLAPRKARLALGLGTGDADLVLTNPPFLEPGRTRPAPDPDRARAHVMPAGGLAAWLDAAADELRPGGTVVVIHRAEALPALVAALSGRFGGIAVVPVQPRNSAAATRILVRAVKGSRAPFALGPPIVLHGEGGFTAQTDALHRGAARIGFPR